MTLGHYKITLFLVENKANFLKLNHKKESPKTIADSKGHLSITNLFKKTIEKNRKKSKDFIKVYNRITKEAPHCCRYYGQLKSNHHIKIMIQVTRPSGDCEIEGYNPPYKNLQIGACNLENTIDGCKGHTQRRGSCTQECGFSEKEPCNFKGTFG